ncbi:MULTISPECIES: cytochrome C oxidase assembly protein [unclassified Leisingera]|uniref:cytochrome C oxidase assembly protein n=1 Tax=unclassified Leisingera TaxID=2614906 RepID=UPI00101265CF|nr:MULTISPECIES: cytochrome C oxidase assembly protein [unclassified Leisingera]MBQ4824087.1 cytochrome C oxidase assembly protein [Leisingera sp. HS039]MCF6431353.1 cytochrome C oxidase assembly protein [Leisingera sp. MMG026]QAX30487.1 cytochrome C oxidase assembly protein [Leisingera sp. NJS204]QBR35540.1 cytochrome C oxidase assembly protein [Leisingera sp. NJS201]
MALRKEHEIHKRRSGLNKGVGILLGAFVVLVMALTMAKVTSATFKFPDAQGEQN